MSARINREELAIAIARETGVQISNDDPVMALVVAHDVVLDAYEKRWESFTARVERRLESRLRWEMALQTVVAFALICAMGMATWVMTT